VNANVHDRTILLTSLADPSVTSDKLNDKCVISSRIREIKTNATPKMAISQSDVFFVLL
jgi:hypothetical protein